MKSLVVGLGIGRLYVDVLKELGSDVVTVDMDTNKNPDFTSFSEAIASNRFDTVHICTPNFTHEDLFYQYVQHDHKPNSIVFVEKPGFKTAAAWRKATESDVRLMMVKNNQYRSNIYEMTEQASRSRYISINWINFNRIPNPGSWFTNKELAWGGVSRDLVPHLLSYMPMFFPGDYRALNITRKYVTQRSTLEELTSSDYGNVNPNGVYDVDDYCAAELCLGTTRVVLIADWRSMREDDVRMQFDNGTTFELGLCPENAYSNMIKSAVAAQNNKEFWYQEKLQDIWIHKILEDLNGA